jgi:hypothetical protein
VGGEEHLGAWPQTKGHHALPIRDIVRNAAHRRAQRFAAAPPAHFLDVPDAIADTEAAHGNDLRHLADATKPLGSSLADAQRWRLPASS